MRATILVSPLYPSCVLEEDICTNCSECLSKYATQQILLIFVPSNEAVSFFPLRAPFGVAGLNLLPQPSPSVCVSRSERASVFWLSPWMHLVNGAVDLRAQRMSECIERSAAAVAPVRSGARRRRPDVCGQCAPPPALRRLANKQRGDGFRLTDLLFVAIPPPLRPCMCTRRQKWVSVRGKEAKTRSNSHHAASSSINCPAPDCIEEGMVGMEGARGRGGRMESDGRRASLAKTHVTKCGNSDWQTYSDL